MWAVIHCLNFVTIKLSPELGTKFQRKSALIFKDSLIALKYSVEQVTGSLCAKNRLKIFQQNSDL